MAMIVVDWIMLGATIIPKRQRTRPPNEAANEFRFDLMAVKKIQNGHAFLFRHTCEANRMANIHEQCSASSFGMGTHHGMLGLHGFFWQTSARICNPSRTGF